MEIFRLHDLFAYNTGMVGAQQQIAERVRDAARGITDWTLLFPPQDADCFHAHDSPEGKLFKFFDGTLFEGAITQPRFIGGDPIAKQEGLVGEVVAIAAYLAERNPTPVRSAVETLIAAQQTQGDSRPGPRFWNRARAALVG